MKDLFKYLKSRRLLDDALIFLILILYTVGMIFLQADYTSDEVSKLDKDLQDYKVLEQQQLQELKELNYRKMLRLERLISEHEIKLRDLQQAHEERLAEIEEERRHRVQELVKKQQENPGEIADEIEDAFGFTFIDPVFE